MVVPGNSNELETNLAPNKKPLQLPSKPRLEIIKQTNKCKPFNQVY